jgi:PhnB protein
MLEPLNVSELEHRTTIAPWLSVSDGEKALEFYKNAFGGTETYRLEDGEGHVVVAQLAVHGAPFWVQEDADSVPNQDRHPSVRMVVTVGDPDALFNRALAVGATEVAAIHEEHGWRTGRVTDPFGHDWEFSRVLPT